MLENPAHLDAKLLLLTRVAFALPDRPPTGIEESFPLTDRYQLGPTVSPSWPVVVRDGKMSLESASGYASRGFDAVTAFDYATGRFGFR